MTDEQITELLQFQIASCTVLGCEPDKDAAVRAAEKMQRRIDVSVRAADATNTTFAGHIERIAELASRLAALQAQGETALTFKHFQQISWRRSEELWSDVHHKWTVSDWGVALAGECGEVCDAIKKLNRGDGSLEDIGDEIADVVAYAALLASKIGSDLETVTRSKYNKVCDKKNAPHLRIETPPSPTDDPALAVEIDKAWIDLLEKTDRTSPLDYPEMCLITKDELSQYMRAAAPLIIRKAGMQPKGATSDLLAAAKGVLARCCGEYPTHPETLALTKAVEDAERAAMQPVDVRALADDAVREAMDGHLSTSWDKAKKIAAVELLIRKALAGETK